MSWVGKSFANILTHQSTVDVQALGIFALLALTLLGPRQLKYVVGHRLTLSFPFLHSNQYTYNLYTGISNNSKFATVS